MSGGQHVARYSAQQAVQQILAALDSDNDDCYSDDSAHSVNDDHMSEASEHSDIASADDQNCISLVCPEDKPQQPDICFSQYR